MTPNKLSNWIRTATLAAAVTMFGAASAQASLTAVKPPNASEMGIEQILQGTYGGNFSANGNNFTNGAVTATRIDDDLDQVWTGGTFDITAKAKLSGYSQTLGYVGHPGNGPVNHLLDVTGSGLSAGGTLSHVTIGEDFCFVREGDSGTQMSELNENSDGRDHMISYAIHGLSNPDTYLLFFEDMDLTASTWKNRSYADYNDLVVQVNRSSATPLAAPLPPAV